MTGGASIGILWLRRDLRLGDHPALAAALAAHEHVVPVFCFDKRLLHGRHRSGPRTQFLLECLADLDGRLRERGSGLVVRHGKPERELVELARELGAGHVHVSADVSPLAGERGERVRRAFAAAGIELHSHPGLNAVDVRAVETKAGRPYSVFSPFFRTWLELERRELLEAPEALPGLPAGLRQGEIPALEALGLEQEVAEPKRGGETEAQRTLDAFLDDGIHEYVDNHDALGQDKTSRLSPYLRTSAASRRARSRSGCRRARGRPLPARAARRPRRVHARALDDAAADPKRGRLRDRRGLPGADRRPQAGPDRGARALPDRLARLPGGKAHPRARNPVHPPNPTT